MVTILHGDNSVASRKVLIEYIEQARSHASLVHLAAKDLTIPALEDALGTQELFSSSKVVVIEGLLGLPISKRKDQMIDMVAGSSQEIVLWEGKTATPAQLKKFTAATKVQVFKTSPVVFQWLDSLKPGNIARSIALLTQAEKQESAEMCFAMLVRHVRLMIQLKSGEVPKMAPFAVAKLKKQVEGFPLETLLALHEKLVEIDEMQKTSSSLLSLRGQLDLLLTTM